AGVWALPPCSALRAGSRSFSCSAFALASASTAALALRPSSALAAASRCRSASSALRCASASAAALSLRSSSALAAASRCCSASFRCASASAAALALSARGGFGGTPEDVTPAGVVVRSSQMPPALPLPRRPLLATGAAFLSLRPMPRFFPACAVPCLADVYPLRLRLNGAWFGLLLGGALPQLAVGLPLGAFPVGGALPRLAVGLPLGAFPVAAALPPLAVLLPPPAVPPP